MIMLDLSDGGLSDDGLSDGMVIKLDQIDEILPRGLLMLTLGLAVGIDGDLGKGTYAGWNLWSNIKSHHMRLIKNALHSKSARITVMVPLKNLASQKQTLPGWML